MDSSCHRADCDGWLRDQLENCITFRSALLHSIVDGYVHRTTRFDGDFISLPPLDSSNSSSPSLFLTVRLMRLRRRKIPDWYVRSVARVRQFSRPVARSLARTPSAQVQRTFNFSFLLRLHSLFSPIFSRQSRDPEVGGAATAADATYAQERSGVAFAAGRKTNGCAKRASGLKSASCTQEKTLHKEPKTFSKTTNLEFSRSRNKSLPW